MVGSSFFDRVLKTINNHGMLRGGESVLVAVSGGPDSVVLLHVLKRLQPVLDLDLIVFHLNHKLRGLEADEDARFVGEFAAGMGLKAMLVEADVRLLMKQERFSLEEAAREARYREMERLAVELGIDKIALGHHADDRVETFLMRLLRGTGLEGLGSIKPVRDGYIRPLIDETKSEIFQYIEDNSLEYRVDSSNQDESILRNRIRHNLMPLLGEYNPRLQETLLNTIDIISEDQAFIEEIVAGIFSKHAQREPGLIKLPIVEIINQPLAIERRLIRLAIRSVKGDLRGVEFKHVDAIVSGLRKGSGNMEIDLPGQIIARAEYEQLVIGERELFEPLGIESIKLTVPGVTRIDALGVEIKAELVEPAGLVFERNGDIAHLDAAVAGLGLKLRVRRPGDSFRPFGMSGEKKLQDLFVDKKISKRERNRVPIIESDGKIAWVAGFRIDDSFRVTEQTKEVLILSLLQI
ncbi:MAG: tRNA lysidine(34) synthetase TilS [Actinomycetota bacterium]|nr:tRNA lysidine(34) synthetase TilS [Actinomycetota bacterium]